MDANTAGLMKMPRRKTIDMSDQVPDIRIDDLIAWTEPLLELFSVVDDVMTEPDWDQKLQIGMGRIRRQWESVVKEFKKEL